VKMIPHRMTYAPLSLRREAVFLRRDFPG